MEPTASRLKAPASYGIDPGSTGGLIPWEHTRERLAASRNYWIATVRPDGSPHTMPVWGVWLDDRFCFATDPASRKGRNLAANREVSVHLESGDEVVIVEGTAEPVTDAALLARIVDAYRAKYDYRPGRDGLYGVRPNRAFAWIEKDFPATAARYAFGD